MKVFLKKAIESRIVKLCFKSQHIVIGETPAAPRDILLCLKLRGFGK